MPKQVFRRKVSDAEMRLTILYSLSAIKQVTPAQLWQFLSELEGMDYISTMLLLPQLTASGELEQGEHALKGRVYLSDQGRQTLSLFENRIPKSVRDSIDRRAPQFSAMLMERRQVTATYESAQKGDYRLILSLIEGDVPALEMRLHTHRRRVAVKIKDRFADSATQVIGLMYRLASEPESENSRQAAPDSVTASVEALSLTEYRVSASLTAESGITMNFSILLPSLPSANRLCTKINEAPARLASQLLGLLTGDAPDQSTISS